MVMSLNNMVNVQYLRMKLFQLSCVALAGYMTYVQFKNYISNEDVSVVSFRKFNSDIDDLYPSFSICMIGSTGEIFKKDEILKIWSGLNNERAARQYQKSLRGKERNITNISEADFDKITINFIEDILIDFFVRSNKDRRKKPSEPAPIFNSYQDTKHICFSREVKYEKGLMLYMDIAKLDSVVLLELDITLLFFVHQKGALTKQLLSGRLPLYEHKNLKTQT